MYVLEPTEARRTRLSPNPSGGMASRGLWAVGAAFAAAALLGLAGCASAAAEPSEGSSIDVAQATWTDGAWPFTVPTGILGCTKPGSVTFNYMGDTYGLNGIALDHGFPAVDPIWRTDGPGTKVSIGSMIEKGLTLCNVP